MPCRGWRRCSRAERPLGLGVVVQPQADLLEVVAALHPSGRLARRLHRRQQQRDQDADDRNHDQKLHQGKTAGAMMAVRCRFVIGSFPLRSCLSLNCDSRNVPSVVAETFRDDAGNRKIFIGPLPLGEGLGSVRTVQGLASLSAALTPGPSPQWKRGKCLFTKNPSPKS